ncbi:hypothetical protein CU098_011362, partial [Rhizopus stolonifer]
VYLPAVDERVLQLVHSRLPCQLWGQLFNVKRLLVIGLLARLGLLEWKKQVTTSKNSGLSLTWHALIKG